MSAIHHWHDFDRNHFRDTVLRWIAGAAIILAAHAAAVYGALYLRGLEPPAEMPPAAVMIELAALPVSAPSEVEDLAPGPQMVQAPETTPDATDEPETETPPPEPVERKVVEEDLPKIEPSPQQSEVVLQKPEPEPVPLPLEKPKPPEKEKPKPKAKPTKRKQAPVTSAAPRTETAPAQRTAAPSQGASSSNSMSRATWAAMVSAHLNRFKRYPPGAQGITGRPSVRFTLDSSGRVTGVSLTRSSGSSVLDAEAVATVRRASPFPRPPDGNGASFSVPVNFTSR
ncbi:energy transducer TonB family protein [Xanthobacter pseudotagetidis]|uniref:energy transducer TonB family protein n=1 Tax=Xanthobacter pseudotagetidis TaxID=3119911 RepID=UPI0037288A78